MKTRVIIFTVVVLLLSLPIVGLGAATIEKIESYLAYDMKFMVDGELWHPKDLDGSELFPIIFNGRSYVPVRTLLENKGVKVDFNDSERTIILNYPKIDNSSNGMPNRISMNAVDDVIKYELTFNNDSIFNDFTSKTMMEFDLNNDTKISINGNEMSVMEITTDGITYLLEGGADGKYFIEADKNTKAIKLISFNGTEIKSSDEIESGVIVNFTKTRHETAKNSISNIR